MRFLSLFAGIGGMDLGLERAGWTCAGQVEINPFCQRVLAKHWPLVKRMGDIRDVRGDEFGPLDAIVGGFPCQDISNAGKRAGIDGEQSGLWTEFARILRVVRPAIAIVENVAALLERDIARVLGDLAASGFDAEWDCLPASAFGSYHERDRVFVVAHDARVCGDSWNCLDASRERRASLQRGRLHRVAVASRAKRENSRLEFEPRLDRLVHGIPDRTHRLAAAGNAVVPAVAEYIGRAINEARAA